MLMKSKKYRFSFTLITALLVSGIAVLAGLSLWKLRRMREEAAHAYATELVVEQGKTITAHLAGLPEVCHAESDSKNWSSFSKRVQSLYRMEQGLQYVSVIRGGVTVFHEQRGALDNADAPGILSSDKSENDVRLVRRLLSIGGQTVPVVVFTKTFTGSDGSESCLEVAMRKDIVAREEHAAASAIASMFSLAMVTIGVAFSVCVLLVVWMMHREHQRERKRRAEEHLAFAGVMANGIVHDFRNPMSSLKLDIQMLGRELERGGLGDVDKLNKLSERVRKTIDRMDKVFEEFLYASKPSGDYREAIDLAEAVSECLSILEPRLEKAAVKVTVVKPPEPVNVLVYKASFQRALMNVIVNAEQFADNNYGAITVRMSGDGKRGVVEVEDNGPGVSASDRSKIFDMFESSRPGGTGLGLFFARTAVERCGGRIDVVSGSYRGACFRIELPAVS